MSEPGRQPGRLLMAPLTGAVAVAATGLLGWEASGDPSWRTLPAWIVDQLVWGLPGLALLASAAVFTLLLARTQRWLSAVGWVILSSGLALLLGIAAYSRCATWATWPSFLVWLLNLFTGQFEDAVIGPDAATACQGPFTLGFQSARMLGLGAVWVGAVAVLLTVFRVQVDRLLALASTDSDLVIGLDEDSLPLVQALIDERVAASDADGYRRLHWGRRIWRRLVSRVLVIHPTPSDPLVSQARAAGARVVIGDPSDTALLKAILTGRGNRITLRRLYAVSGIQQRNLDVLHAARSIIAEANAGTEPVEWLSTSTVPRLVARFDDAREAHDWRLRELDAPGCFVDALAADELLARAIVTAVLDGAWAPSDAGEGRTVTVALLGDTPLTLALLDEFALQQAFRRELWAKAKQPDPGVRVSAVIVVADSAESALEEWRRHRAPHAVPDRGFPLPEPVRGDWEAALGGLGPTASLVVAIVAEAPGAAVSARATRLTRMHPGVLVFAPDGRAQGVENPIPGLPNQTLIRYGTTLLEGTRPPDDSWTILARQAHEVYCAGQERTRGARRPWFGDLEQGIPALSQFYKDDNLRQLRYLLLGVGGWHAVRDRPSQLLDDARLVACAQAEHERWCMLRQANGWTLPDPVEMVEAATASPQRRAELREKWERAKQNTNLVTWEDGFPRTPTIRWNDAQTAALAGTGHKQWNIMQVSEILERLAGWGIAPGHGSDVRVRP